MKKSKPLKRITISVDDLEYLKLEVIAELQSCSVSYLVRQAMKAYIKQLEQTQDKKIDG